MSAGTTFRTAPVADIYGIYSGKNGVSKSLYDTADLSVYETNKNLLYTELTKMGFEIVEPGGTFYMFPKALEADAVAFSDKAKALDLLLVPSDTFGVKGHFRINSDITNSFSRK